MVNFNLKKSAIFRSVLLDEIFLFRYARQIGSSLLFLSFFLLLFYLGEKNLPIKGPFFEWGVFFFSLSLIFYETHFFFESVRKSPPLLVSINEAADHFNEFNLADFLDFQTAKIVFQAKKRGPVDSYSLIFFILKNADELSFIFSRAVMDKYHILDELEGLFSKKNVRDADYSEDFLKVMREAFFSAVKRGDKRVRVEDVFLGLVKHNAYFRELFYKKNLKKEDLVELISWLIYLKEKEKPFLYKNLIKKGSIGEDWVSGYTPFLDNFSINWTKAMKFAGFPETIGHKEEVELLERVLSRNGINSAVITGDPGTGRKSIVQGVIKKSFLGESFPEVNKKRFLELDLPSLLAHANGREETEKMIDEVFGEVARAGNVVLIIDNFHNFLEESNRPGSANIAGILESYLHYPNFKIIGITSRRGFHEKIEPNPSILSLLEKIEVKEIEEKETLLLLQKRALYFEKTYKKLISFSALKRIIFLSKKYMQESFFPEKAIDLLEEAVVYAVQEKKEVVFPGIVDCIVSRKTEIPVGEVEEEEKEILLNMEVLIHEKIIDQEEAVKTISSALRRSRANLDTRKGVIGGFLFLGPTGVGKTETAKVLAEVYFGKKKKVNRLDMSEFQNISDVSRLIGSAKEEGLLTSRAREDPFSLILLDEIEKAHPDILNLFLQVLDEGHLTDGKGRVVSFENCMLIATSNAGHQIILSAVEEKKNWEKTKEKVVKNLLKENIFRPEFINRFDDVVLFKPLEKEHLFSIAKIQLQGLKDSLEEKEINFEITEELKEKIVEISYNPVFGAREMQRMIQKNIGETLSFAILKEDIKRGESFKINPENFAIEKI